MAKVGIVLAVDGEKQFAAAMKSAQSQSKLLKTELEGLKSDFKDSANTMGALEAVLGNLKEQQSNYTKVIENGRKAQEKAKEVTNERRQRAQELAAAYEKEREKLEKLAQTTGNSSQEYKEQKEATDKAMSAMLQGEAAVSKAEKAERTYATQVKKAENSLKEVDAEIQKNEKYLDEAKASTDGAAKSIDKYGNEAKEAAKESKTLGSSLGDIAKIAIGNIAADAINRIGDAAKEAAKYVLEVGSNFEAAMSEVQAISGASGSEFITLQKKAEELGKSTKFSASDAAAAFKYMSLAGWDAQTSLSAVDGVMDLAAASGMDLASASDMVTDYLSAFGLEASYAARMSDELAYAQAHSNTTTEQLGEAFGNSAAAMAAGGQSMEDSIALLEAFANQGTKGSEAGTELAGIMSQITQKMSDGAIKIGDMSVAVTDADGNFRSLIDIMADVEQATNGMGDAEKSAALAAVFNRTSLRGVNQILNESTSKIKGYRQELDKADGSAKSMASTMQDNLAGDMTKMNSALEGLGIAAYDYVDGPVRGVVQGVTDIIGGITDLITPQTTAIGDFAKGVQQADREVKSMISNAENTLTGGQTQVAEMEAYRDILLSAADAAKLNAGDQALVQYAVDKMADTVPGLTEAWDAQNGVLNMSAEALNKAMDGAEGYVLEQAAMAAQVEATTALMEAQVNKAMAQSAYDQLTEKRTSAIKEYEDALAEYGGASEITQEANKKMGDTIRETNADWKEAGKAVEETGESLTKAQEVYDLSGDAIETAKKATADYIGVKLDEQEATKDTADTSQEAAEQTIQAYEDKEKAVTAAEKKIADAEKELQDAVSSATDSIKKSMESQIHIFDEWNPSKKIDAEDMLKNLKKSTEGLKNWAKNMEELGKLAGNGMSQGLYDELVQMGPSAANQVQELVDTLHGDKDLFNQISKEYAEALDISNESSEIQAGYTSTVKDANAAAQKEIQEGNAELKRLGAEGASNVAEGLSSGKDEVASAAGEAASQTMDEYAKGVTDQQGTVNEATTGVGTAGADALRKQYLQYNQAGQQLAKMAATGVTSQRSVMYASASGLASSAVSGARGHYSDMYSVGRNLSSGVASGIRAGKSGAVSAARDMVRAAVNAAKSEAKINSPSKVMRDEVGEGLAEGTALGIKQNTYQSVDAMRDSVRKTISAAKETVPEVKLNTGTMNIINSLAAPAVPKVDISPIASALSTGSTENTFNVTLNISGADNPEEWGQRFIDEMTRMARQGA